eukprot:g25083.t1
MVYEWDEENGEGFIIPSEEQDAFRMIRVYRRDISWHDSRRCWDGERPESAVGGAWDGLEKARNRQGFPDWPLHVPLPAVAGTASLPWDFCCSRGLFPGQFLQFETALPEEVPWSSELDPRSPVALRVRGLEILFSLKEAYELIPEGSREPLLLEEQEGRELEGMMEEARSLAPSPDRTAFPVTPERPELAVQKKVHPLLQRFASDAPQLAQAESPSWLWQPQLDYFKEENYAPIMPVQLGQVPVRPKRKRILVHEVAHERGDTWQEAAQRKGVKLYNKMKPPGRRMQEKLSMRFKEETVAIAKEKSQVGSQSSAEARMAQSPRRSFLRSPKAPPNNGARADRAATSSDCAARRATARCRPLCTASCFCHVCYICQFVIYLLIFPLWAKWLVTSPMPTEYWNQAFPAWPVIPTGGGRAIGENEHFRPIEITPIPSTPESCNYSCVANGAQLNHAGDTEVAFEVGLTLNDPKLSDKNIHAVYPVLLASENFQDWLGLGDWYVVGDRRHASPTPFWSSKIKE